MSSTLRCLAVLRLLSEEPYEMSVTEAGKRLGIAKASAHRLFATLMDAGFVGQDPVTLRYHVGGGALWVGTSFIRRSMLYRSSFLLLQDLARELDATAHLGILDDGAVMFLYAVGSTRNTHILANVGDRRPLHATAIGKALLAELPVSEIERVLDTGQKYTENTIVSLPEMLTELEIIRRRGFAVNNEEWLRGYRAVGAPVRGPRGTIIAAINVSGSPRLFQGKQLAQSARAVVSTALKISLQLGYRFDPSRSASPAARR